MTLFDGADWVYDRLEEQLIHVGNLTDIGFYAYQPSRCPRWVATVTVVDVDGAAPPFPEPTLTDGETAAMNLAVLSEQFKDDVIVKLTPTDTAGPVDATDAVIDQQDVKLDTPDGIQSSLA